MKKHSHTSSLLLLQSTLCLLDLASSRTQEKEQLVRDIGIGSSHVARDHLIRKGILRTPIVSLKAKLEGHVEMKSGDALQAPIIQYKIRCGGRYERNEDY